MSPPDTRPDPAGRSGAGLIESLGGGIDSPNDSTADVTVTELAGEPYPHHNLWVERLIAAEIATRRPDGVLLADLIDGHGLWFLPDRVWRRADDFEQAAATIRQIGDDLDAVLSRLHSAPSLGQLRGVA